MRRFLRLIFKLQVPLMVLAFGSWNLMNATHFRYGHIVWNTGPGNTINFTIQNGWRLNDYGGVCINTTNLTVVPCKGPGGLPGVGDVIIEFIGGTLFFPGDGTPGKGSPFGPLLFLVTSIDPANNWLFGLALDPTSLPGPPTDTTVNHTYATAGNFLANISSCCRISSLLLGNAHINNPDGPYRVETLVNVGTGNRSPVSALPPIVACVTNSVCSFIVPASDPDGDALRFRLSTASEAGSGIFVQPGTPFAPNSASISSVGVYSWNTTGATLGPTGSKTFYSTQVTIEDRDSAGVTKGKVAIDFLILLVDDPNGKDPVFTPPPPGAPSCGSTITATPGQTTSFVVQASDPDAGQTVTLNAVGLPVGAVMTPQLPVTGNPVSSVFTWTPTAAQLGTVVVTFEARDNVGRQLLCSITNNVIPAVPVKIDLKPGSNPNCVNPNSAGNVAVAIFGSSTFNASAINASTVKFGGASAKKCSLEDARQEGPTRVFTSDGIADLVCQFDTKEVVFPLAGSNCGVMKLEGALNNGSRISGNDVACLAGEGTCNASQPIPIP